ncbi:Txe/YoeB family addiction module toxin [Sphingobacterium wenxiniae]|uniref:Putative mRNA interferase YoeB n=1 Tax=Sphingobacterium wenxiniae TaxID=683125 RepID=A0A1I6S2T4_9SPHI|nr:Txe/YoeB family addiction module toxin [Sphingobacterium wenxiniae]SFS71271.1 toxin YoeB [Sphingobacterium wenxiniae]
MKYSLIFTPEADEDVKRIKKSGNKALFKKLNILLEEISEHPKTGTGKPEQLKHYTEPTWSRRVSAEHRLVYEIQEEVITVLVLSAYGHYGDK